MKFAPLWRTILYVVSFVLLSLHLWHGFASSFQSMGLNNKYTPAIKSFTKAYALLIPLVFICIAIYHHLNPISN
jgi:succinate dehydrogenase / fumarate reductase cytochrome b subunit